jgi:hypothetical protein
MVPRGSQSNLWGRYLAEILGNQKTYIAWERSWRVCWKRIRSKKSGVGSPTSVVDPHQGHTLSPVVPLPLDSQWPDLNPKCISKWPLLYIYTLNRNIKRSPPRCIVIYNSCECVSIPVIEAPCIPEGKTSYSTDLSWHIYNLHCWRLLNSRELRSSELEQRSAILPKGTRSLQSRAVL